MKRNVIGITAIIILIAGYFLFNRQGSNTIFTSPLLKQRLENLYILIVNKQ